MIAFVHTSPVHVESFDRLLGELAPQVRAAHHVDESLLVDARHRGITDPGLIERVQQAMQRMAAGGARVVVCTCSTIGGIAERSPTDGSYLPMRIDRAMADEATRHGPRLAVLAALQSTLAPTVALIEDSAQRLGRTIAIQALSIPDAWPCFERGEMQAYHQCIATAVREQASGFPVVVLAQASMAGATAWLNDFDTPVLSSPRLGVKAALAALKSIASQGHSLEPQRRSTRCD